MHAEKHISASPQEKYTFSRATFAVSTRRFNEAFLLLTPEEVLARL